MQQNMFIKYLILVCTHRYKTSNDKNPYMLNRN